MHRHCGSRDITDLNFDVAFQDSVIKKTWDLMEGTYSLYVPTLSMLAFLYWIYNHFSLSYDLARSSEHMFM